MVISRIFPRASGSSPEPRVFVSYKRRDIDSVRSLAMTFAAAFGSDQVFFDLDDIHVGEQWETKLHTEVVASDALIVAISQNWLAELTERAPSGIDYVVREISVALEQSVPIVPVVLPGVSIPSPDALPEAIRGLFKFQAKALTHERWDSDVYEIIERIRELALGVDASERERKARLARGVAWWYGEAPGDERILCKMAGIGRKDPTVLLTDRRCLLFKDSVASPIQIEKTSLLTACRDESDLFLLDENSEFKLRGIPGEELKAIWSVLISDFPETRRSDKAPDDLIRREQRIHRARSSLAGSHERFVTGGMRSSDDVILITDDRSLIYSPSTEGVRPIPHAELSAICHHKGSMWLIGANSDRRIERIPEHELVDAVATLQRCVPGLDVYPKAPDREVFERIRIFGSDSFAERSGIDLDWTKHMRLSDEETIILAASKLMIMEADLSEDPDFSDRLPKRRTIDAYVDGLLATFRSADVKGKSIDNLGSLRREIGRKGWVATLRTSLGKLEAPDVRSLLRDEQLGTRLLAQVSERDRALLLLIELASFHPWGDGVKFEKGVKEDLLAHMADVMGAEVDISEPKEIERELKERGKYIGGDDRNWGRLALFVGGGAALGVLTGGLAAPLIGSMIGSAMGLSGAAATSAGLALLGGGSVASGGLGLAGGTALIGVVGGAAGTAAGVGGDRLAEMGNKGLVTESVKLDVLTKYVLLRERGEVSNVSSMVDLIERELMETQRTIDQRRRLESPKDKSLLDKTKEVVSKVRSETDELIERSEILERIKEGLIERLEDFISEVDEWISREDRVVEDLKRSELPALVVGINVAEGALEMVDRASHLIPALIAREDGEPLGHVLIEVMSGRNETDGKEALRRRGVTHQLAGAIGGSAIDVFCHPLIWAATAAAMAGAHAAGAVGPWLTSAIKSGELTAAVIPAGLAKDWLDGNGIEAAKLAKGLVELVNREMKETLGGAAIQVAEGLVVSLSGLGGDTPEPCKPGA